MPLFEYLCPRCGEKREVLVRSAGAANAPTCPVCGADMDKQWAPVATHTKSGGSGCAAPRGGFS